ncbi:hypothetical protein MBLNU230_g1072t1 [Neophaeotheca triangularis]
MAPVRKKQRLSNDMTEFPENSNDAPAAVEKNPAKPQDETAKPEQPKRSLFVRSLPQSATSQSLTELFSESFPIKHATVVTDPATKQCKGYGFVTFADAEDAQQAKEQFNGHLFDGRKLRIEVAEARHRDEKGKSTAPSKPVKEATGKHGPEATAPASSKLIVRNLPWTIKKSDQLAKLFLSYGKVKQAYIPTKPGGLLAGFGFVVMRGRKNAEKAMEGVNGKEVDGRTLAVDWTVEKETFESKTEQKDDKDTQDAVEDGEDGEEEEEANREHLDGMSDYDEDSDDHDDEEDGSKEDSDEEEESEVEEGWSEDRSSTLFIRNLPFTCTDEDLEDHFRQFGATRYARVVMDPGTDRSKGTGFVCFYNRDDADSCLREAPRRMLPAKPDTTSGPIQVANSVLQNEESDPSGRFTLDGRVLQVTRAVNKTQASRFTEEGQAHRNKRDKDKRRLYLLSEGTIPSNSKTWEALAPSERTMRDASAKQRKTLIESNPSLHLSLTRLSVRNLPRSIGSKELKALAREAVVGFATDAKAGTRSRLSKEELSRGGEEMVEAEKERKKHGKGIVKQAKVVFEAQGGGKVGEDTGAGRSRGYGFIEYYTHRSALMGLRWLNGHAIGYQVKEGSKGKLSKDEMQDRKKRLIVEFAIENAQVVLRRKDREGKARERSKAVQSGAVPADGDALETPDAKGGKGPKGQKRKRSASDAQSSVAGGAAGKDAGSKQKKPMDEKLAKRNHIIGKKRAMRKERGKGKA